MKCKYYEACKLGWSLKFIRVQIKDCPPGYDGNCNKIGGAEDITIDGYIALDRFGRPYSVDIMGDAKHHKSVYRKCKVTYKG